MPISGSIRWIAAVIVCSTDASACDVRTITMKNVSGILIEGIIRGRPDLRISGPSLISSTTPIISFIDFGVSCVSPNFLPIGSSPGK